ncbi:ligase-associated DNA damage response DEXH box helicase [Lichenifustis flavocetrariae]|uniref:Ligase-associated DNA damage response DEXH box helicase n=1 Tax=Lichenifustis flavocetrariae TaxID=2949735 RepID=A0AA41YXL4_9HYPH|nr:ligase-associated DNA damage response DEXH box helicase [Lichenifustis flavocetrariae]MCW6506788.1 ligase-associated DNA damage response DEXH box helicase [Lichenifustis flavocetrariae]
MLDVATPLVSLPPRIASWFAARGWSPRLHQLALLAHAAAGQSALLIAPTGAGKTLAGFLPSLVDLMGQARSRPALHTLYISPLKALSVDVARNIEIPVSEMGLPIRIETRTGDTPAGKRQRQRRDPPDILLTTPEQLALLLASPDAAMLFGDLRRIVLDELHALVTNKRGDLLSLGLARLRRLAPGVQTVGLSATVREPAELAAYLRGRDDLPPALVVAPEGARAEISMLDTRERLPWAGHSARHALDEIYQALRGCKMALIFTNTRFQAEQLFWDLWKHNAENLPIALHHGSLDASQRRRVEAAMAEGTIKAVVCTATLDLGIDWGDVDLVINVGAPKGASRITQRIGRANHRLDEPSRALLVPANRFEVIECRAAIDAASHGVQDTPVPRTGALDVLAQHVLGMACAAPFRAEDLHSEITDAAPYAAVTREDFDRVLDFVAHGGYALKAYERFAKIRQDKDGRWRVSNGRIAQQYRMNVGTIVAATMLKVRLVRSRTGPMGQTLIGRGGRVLGEMEDGFLESLVPGDTFIFGGEILALQAIVEDEALVQRVQSTTPKIPAWGGSKFPLSTYLASRVRSMLSEPHAWPELPSQVQDWLDIQAERSLLPPPDSMLVETFPRGGRHYLVAYPFEGRLAHQTLGMLLTRRLERERLKPLGFVGNDYALAVWMKADIGARIKNGLVDLDGLFGEDMLGDDLEAWLDESSMMKRTFRSCAIIAGLIEKRHPGREKTGRQMTVSTDLVYDVLRRHEPDHILLRAAREDAATGLLDLKRLGDLLLRIKGRIIHKDLDRVSPLAVPIMLEIGREPVYGEAQDEILAEAADVLVEEACGVEGRSFREPA